MGISPCRAIAAHLECCAPRQKPLSRPVDDGAHLGANTPSSPPGEQGIFFLELRHRSQTWDTVSFSASSPLSTFPNLPLSPCSNTHFFLFSSLSHRITHILFGDNDTVFP